MIGATGANSGQVEADSGFVPVEDPPLEAGVAMASAHFGKCCEQGFSEAGVAGGGADEHILQVDVSCSPSQVEIHGNTQS
jgi:hypothetical protein